MSNNTTHERLKRPIFFAIVLIGLLWGGWSDPPAHAATQNQASEIRLEVRAGFDSYYRPTAWVPVRITVANSGQPIDGSLRITVRSSTSLNYDSPISLPTRSEKVVNTYVYLPRFTDRITAQLLDARGKIIAAADSPSLRRVDEESLLYVVAAPDAGELALLETVTGTRSGAEVATVTLGNLPEAPAAWNALDVLVLNNVDTGTLTNGQSVSMAAWLETGGQLVVTGGPGWQATSAGIADWLPVKITGASSVTDLPALQAAGGEPFRDPGPYLLAESTLQNGEILFHQDGLPLMAVRQQGAGQIYFLALDPQLAPLADWDGGDVLWKAVAERVPERSFWTDGVRDAQAASTAAGMLPSVSLPSGFQLVLFLVAYIAAVGPVNYLVLKRRGRLELAWFTTPVLIISFTALAYVIGFRVKGNDAILNELSVISGTADAGSLRRETLVGLYSPRRDRYDLTLPAVELVRPFDATNGDLWAGGIQEAVVRNADVTVADILVDVSDVATFVTNGLSDGLGVDGEVLLDLSAGTYEVTLRNDGQTTLESASLLLGNLSVRIGNLPPGATWQETHPVVQTAAGTAASSGLPGPTYGSASPLSPHYGTLLGSADYFNDRDLQARFQLLRALEEPFSGSGRPLRAGTATLIAWSDAPQLTFNLSDSRVAAVATSLYLLDLPVREFAGSGEPIHVPETLWSWAVLASSGGFEFSPDRVDLYDGWVEFEYVPWPVFRDLDDIALGVDLSRMPGSTTPLPDVRIWSWDADEWQALADIGWGQTMLVDPDPYLGPGNSVRLRVQSSGVLLINSIYPILIGTPQ